MGGQQASNSVAKPSITHAGAVEMCLPLARRELETLGEELLLAVSTTPDTSLTAGSRASPLARVERQQHCSARVDAGTPLV
jgi:hypothetical protein